MIIFVVGKLGEVIKKVLELEDILRENPTNSILVAELTSYQEVLLAWPVLDKDLVHQAIQVFKLNIAKLKQAEESLRQHIGSGGITLTISLYLQYLDNVRSDLATLNELGMHIGPSPYLELHNDEVAKSEDQYSISFGECAVG